MNQIMKTETEIAISKSLSKTIDQLPVKANDSIAMARRHCVGQLSKNGKEMAIPAIEVAVALLADFFGREFSEIQIKETARLIYDNWYWFDVVEFKIALDRIKTQHYEKCFGHLSPAYIMDVFQKVAAESLNARDNDSFNDYDRVKKEDENDRSLYQIANQKQEERIHASAVEEFKKKLEQKKK